MCGPQFTVLFIKTFRTTLDFDDEPIFSTTDLWEQRVIITPTSSGLRKLLKEERERFDPKKKKLFASARFADIDFSAPVNARRLSAESSTNFLGEDGLTSDSPEALAACGKWRRRETTPELENQPPPLSSLSAPVNYAGDYVR